MEGLPLESDGASREGRLALIDRVPHDRKPQMLQMDSDLMSPTGFEPAVHERDIPALQASLRDGLYMGDCGLSAHLQDGLFLAIARVAADRCLDRPAIKQPSPGHCPIPPRDGSGLQLSNEFGLALQGLGDHHEPRGVSVQPVNNARPRKIAQRGRMSQEPVQQCALRVARRGMNHQPGRLIEDDEVLILREDAQLHGLGHPVSLWLRLRHLEGHPLPRLDWLAWANPSVLQRDQALLNPPLESSPRLLWKPGRKQAIQPLPELRRLDQKNLRLAIIGALFSRKVFMMRQHGWTLGSSSRALSLVLAMLMTAALSGCASGPDSKDETLRWTPERLYQESKSEMSAGNYAQAVALLRKLESRYPFGRFAQQAQLDTAYAQFKEGDLVQALASIERFMRLNPNHPSVDYALYLKGLINFNDRATLFSSVTGEDMSERDPKAAKEAFDTFKQLVTRFPESRYAPDAAARLQFLINTLAQGEVHTARFYLRRGAYMAGANRAQNVIRSYQDSPAVEEALAQMIFSYDKLGLGQLRDDARRVLERTAPNSPYLKHGYNPSLMTGLATEHQPNRGPSLWSRLKMW